MNSKNKHAFLKYTPFFVLTFLCGVFVVSFSWYLNQEDTNISSTESDASEGEVISLMSYNIMWPDQTDERLDRITDCIIEENVDIVGFQEANGLYSRDIGNRNTLEDLKQILVSKGKNFYSTSVERRTIGILSKFPVLDYFSATFSSGDEYRGYQTGVINVQDRIFRIVNIHPTANPLCAQNNELHGILSDSLYSLHSGTFIMGDFNMPLGDPGYPCNNLFREDWIYGCDPYLNSSCLDSINDEVWHRYGGSGEAAYILDNVMFNNDGWSIKDAYVSTSQNCSTSDHFPVVVRFEYQGDTECIPSCTAKCGGADGCGGVCPNTCSGSTPYCRNNTACVSCTSDIHCTEGKTCNSNGQCVSSCTPNCTNKVCGPNGCGDSCGTCATGTVCNASGQCLSTDTSLVLRLKIDLQIKSDNSNQNVLVKIKDSVGKVVYDNSHVSDSSGNVTEFALSDVGAGTYSIWVKPSNYLARKVTRDLKVGVNDIVFEEHFLAGDLDDNISFNVIKSADYSILIGKYFQEDCGVRNLDGNCMVNAKDISIMYGNWFKMGDVF